MTDAERLERLELIVSDLCQRVIGLGLPCPVEVNILNAEVEARAVAKRRALS